MADPTHTEPEPQKIDLTQPGSNFFDRDTHYIQPYYKVSS